MDVLMSTGKYPATKTKVNYKCQQLKLSRIHIVWQIQTWMCNSFKRNLTNTQFGYSILAMDKYENSTITTTNLFSPKQVEAGIFLENWVILLVLQILLRGIFHKTQTMHISLILLTKGKQRAIERNDILTMELAALELAQIVGKADNRCRWCRWGREPAVVQLRYRKTLLPPFMRASQRQRLGDTSHHSSLCTPSKRTSQIQYFRITEHIRYHQEDGQENLCVQNLDISNALYRHDWHQGVVSSVNDINCQAKQTN
jgi:hypothetical protein